MVIRIRIWRVGVGFVCLFLIYCFYFVFSYRHGQGQAPIFIFMATMPFSMAVNSLVDHWQVVYGWDDSRRVAVEIFVDVFIGCIFYYVLGAVLAKVVRMLNA